MEIIKKSETRIDTAELRTRSCIHGDSEDRR